MILLSTEGLSIGYGSGRLAADITLTLSSGSITCILGPNGAGKTTLFKTLLGLTPPLSGTIKIGKTDIRHMSRAEISKHVAYVPQATTAAFAFTVLDLALMGRTAHLPAFGTPRRDDVDAARAALGTLCIDALAHKDADRVSGGQRQLAFIARALAQASPLILMDEPTASLDLANRHLVTSRIRELADGGLAVALSSHEPELAFEIASQVALLGSGGSFQVGTVDALLTSERLSELYEVPLTVETTSSGRRVVSPSRTGASAGRS